MTKQSELGPSSDSSLTGDDLDDDALEEARADGEVQVVVGGMECEGVLLSLTEYMEWAQEASSNLKALGVGGERCWDRRSNDGEKPVESDGEDR